MKCREVLPFGMVCCSLLLPSVFSQNIIQPDGELDIWACISPAPYWPVYISFSTSAIDNSGYHNHTSGRPQGVVNPTGGYTDVLSGCVHTVFSVPQQIAGDYSVQAYSGGFYDGVQVGVYHTPWLQILPPNHYAYQVVGQTGSHPTNNYGTFNAVYSIQQICIAFYNQTGLKAGVNDMSLAGGGLFDIGPPYGSYWQSPHAQHRKGLNADIPYQYLGTLAQREIFRQFAVAWFGDPLPEGNHYHLRFTQ